ncbi:MAG: tetratricopeptide repeat protein [Burkholderiaceae bacterium]|nr:tetratricopeptide repeat protein [Burkholderiaceae bacterium]
MAYDLEEQEKIDQLRAWWGNYGTAVLTFLVVLLLLVAGWRGWQWYEGHQANQARGYFEALEDATRQTGDESVARITAAATTLRSEFGKTDYAARGGLVAAAALQARGDLAAAQSQLEWIARSGHPALVPVAKLRLAGLLFEKADYDAALAQLQDAPPAFAGLFADRRGDILFAQGKQSEARAAWQQSIAALGPTSQLAPAIKLKLDALGS